MKSTLLQSLLAGLLGLASAQAALANDYAPLFKAKKYADIDKLATSRLAAEPNQPDALVAKVRLILIENKESRLDEGVKLAEQCVSTNPRHSGCHEMLGNVLGTKVQKGSIFAAMAHVGKIKDSFKTAVELDPNNFNARSSMLMFYLMAPGMAGGGKDKAQAFVNETSKFNAAAGALLQATMESREERFERAAQLLLTAQPGQSEAMANYQRNQMSNLGHVFIDQKKFGDAEKMFREVMQRFASDHHGYYGMGKLLQEQGNAKDALPMLEKALGIQQLAAAHYRMGKCWQALGDKPKALAAYERALAMQAELAKEARSDAENQVKALKKA